MQCGLLEYSQWTAGRVLCSALCGWGGFWIAAFVPAVPPVVVPAGAAASPSSTSELEGPSPDEQKGKYISKELLPDEVPDTSSGSLLRQFQSSVPGNVPIHPSIQECLLTLLSPVLLAEDTVIRDSVDKKVDVSLKKAYAGTHLAFRAGIYGTYVAQSSLSDLKALNSALDGSSDCSGLMSFIERQVEFLTDISFDVVQASALAEGACVSACRDLVLRDRKMDAAQRASALRLPFQGNVLFGLELEEKLHKLFKEKKHSSSFRSTLGEFRLFGKKSPVQAPSR
ncbi:hypothetical protein NDU88_000324 [Pleurodeles waltl]|uniref:Lamina-associated polypeptide 2 alpha C-terminal domain-containing protein n=1 Tax=Pleurodeles waltl TaxID=8319 RepID=A0AAV7UQG8_PLEWA|nr:hypothetical protein NDU88_000324 [Pleurodeles waltl]